MQMVDEKRIGSGLMTSFDTSSTIAMFSLHEIWTLHWAGSIVGLPEAMIMMFDIRLVLCGVTNAVGN